MKDKSVATKMVRFIELNTIGVSQDSQVRATHILQAVVEGYGSSVPGQTSETMDRHHRHRQLSKETLFHYGNAVMQYRWNRLRSTVAASSEFTLPEFVPSNCTFFKRETIPTPGMRLAIMIDDKIPFHHCSKSTLGVFWSLHKILQPMYTYVND